MKTMMFFMSLLDMYLEHPVLSLYQQNIMSASLMSRRMEIWMHSIPQRRFISIPMALSASSVMLPLIRKAIFRKNLALALG